ncbi:MAG: hypothetical protein JNL67_22285 [Planctomycetaceae bacterium]|nr:hypothetical protein [Planctomycetaceae bacterium]
MNSALYFDDLSVGQKWISARRTVTESDVVIFAGMTGDFDRAHVDHDYASKSRFKQPLMHGLMGLTWAAGLSTTAPAVRTLALVSVDQWKFLRPVHIGDTVCAVTEVLELSSGGRSAGKVTWKKSLLNQSGEEVQSGIFVSLVELTPRTARQPALASPKIENPSKNELAKLESSIPAPHFLGIDQQVVSLSSDMSGSLANAPAVLQTGFSEERLVESPPIRVFSELPANDPVLVDSPGELNVWTIQPLRKSETEIPELEGEPTEVGPKAGSNQTSVNQTTTGQTTPAQTTPAQTTPGQTTPGQTSAGPSETNFVVEYSSEKSG